MEVKYDYKELINRLDKTIEATCERDALQMKLIEGNTKAIEKLTFIISGDKDHGIPGMAERLNDTEKKVNKHQSYLMAATAIGCGLCALPTILELLHKLIK